MKFPHKIRRIKTIGDGSCFLHSVVRCIYPEYNDMSEKEKRKLIKDLRRELSELIDKKRDDGKTYYETLSRGQLKDLSKVFPETKLEEMKNFLKSDRWFSHLYVEFISEIFNIDIYIIDYSTGDMYNMGDNEILYKNRNSIVIGYITDSHFEALEIDTGAGLWKTYFSPDCELMKKMKN